VIPLARVAVGGVLLGLALVAPFPVAAQLSAELDALFDAPPFDGMHTGALVVDVETGETIYRRNASMRFVPASNQKLLTTIAALQRLGPDFRFRTHIAAEGAMNPGGILVGDLVVLGSGDPTLSSRFYPSAEAPLVDLATQLRDQGLRRVRGDLVIEAAAWDSTRVEPTWMWGDLPFGYAAAAGPFVIAEGMAEVEARAGAPGTPVVIRWSPVGDPGRFVSSARSVAPSDSTDLDSRLRDDAPGVEITGTLEAFTTETLELNVQQPDVEAGTALVRILGDHGIQVDGAVRVRRTPPPCGSACDAAVVLATLESPPLIEIVRGVLEPSQNWMAEQLIRYMGAADGGLAGWPAGTRAIRRILQSDFGLDSLDLTIRDGSGLSAYNLVTPRALVELLRQVHRRPWAASFARALAEPGEDDSTLEGRLDGLQGRVFAKTGTITHVNSLSGYVDTPSGRRLAFALLTNASGLRSSQVRALLDGVLRRLADGA
jgi:D-alanyl-D-alanine carboxypeptidase/D-alanyl-D-alanine-endopeptidase (penicillin-binding protein 4)